MMLPSATDLVYFSEVAIELNFSRTAIKLNTSQPSLSIAIKRLEKLLNTDLFIRHSNGLTLTRAGHLLHDSVGKLLEQWRTVYEDIRESSDDIKGKITIGCHSTLSPFMSNMVSQLLAQHPGLEINFQHAFTPEIMQNISEGTLDIGIVTDPYPHANIIILPIAETEFTFWVSRQKNSIDLFDSELLIICDLQIPPTQFLLKELQKLRQHSGSPRLSNINQIEAIAAMTIESQGTGILPTAYTEFYFSDQLQKVSGAPVYIKPLCLAYRAESKKIIAITTVLDAIKQLVKKP